LRKVLKYAFVAVLAGALVPVGFAGAQALIDSGDVANNTLRSADIKNGTIRCIDLTAAARTVACRKGRKGDQGAPGANGVNGANGLNGVQGAQGSTGAPGAPGATGAPGPAGDDALTRITSLPELGFDVTNPSCSLVPDGLECGPYPDGGAAGGSMFYDGLNGQTLADVAQLAYEARYLSNGDTGGVGVPYLRIFLENDDHDAIFSPNTQPPDSDTAEGPFHRWVPTSGLWRYDDDCGDGFINSPGIDCQDPSTDPGAVPGYGVNGAPFAQLVAEHGDEVVSGIYITTGFTAGAELASLLRAFEVNNERFVFGSE
jgi:hypothetical protein